MSITSKTVNYREELKEIDDSFKLLLKHQPHYTDQIYVKDFLNLYKRLRKLIKGPFNSKEYHKNYQLKNKEKIQKYQKKYRSIK